MKNIAYSTTNTLLNLFVPLVTIPYLTRVFGPAGIGELNYYISIIGWLFVFAQFGIQGLGPREVAQRPRELRMLATNLLVRNFLLVMVTFVVAIGLTFIPMLRIEHAGWFLIACVSLFGNTLALDWLAAGLLQFRNVALRTLSIKVINLVLIFLLIRQPTDAALYLALTSLVSLTVGGVNLWIFRKCFSLRQLSARRIFEYFVKAKSFFVSSFLGSLYNNLDSVYVGLFLGMRSVAFYVMGRQVFSIAFGLVASAVRVFSVRASGIAVENEDRLGTYFFRVAELVLLLVGLLVVLMFAFSEEIFGFLGGPDFQANSGGFRLFCLALLPTAISVVVIQIIATPLQRQREGIWANGLVAIVCLGLDLFVMPRVGLWVACLALPLGETVGAIFLLFRFRHQLPPSCARFLWVLPSSIVFSVSAFLLLLQSWLPLWFHLPVLGVILCSFLFLMVYLVLSPGIWQRLRSLANRGPGTEVAKESAT